MAVDQIQCGNANLYSCGMNRKAQPSFSGKIGEVKVKEYPDHIEKRTTIEGSTGKKWGAGIASFCLNGLGQFINGDIAKGFAFMVSGLGLASVTLKSHNPWVKLASWWAGVGIGIWSTVDAVKNAKSEVVTIESKTPANKHCEDVE